MCGHGVTCLGLAKVGTDVTTVAISPDTGKNNERTSFGRLSRVLGGPLSGKVPLGEIWPLLFETTKKAPLGDPRSEPLVVALRPRLLVGAHGVDTVELTLPRVIEDLPVDQRPSLAEFLARYPGLRGWRTRTPANSEVTWPAEQQPLQLQWELTEQEAETGHVLSDRLTWYRRHLLAYPTLDQQPQPLHPMMAWWAVLFTLSMLTRYHPAEWTRLVDVNQCEQATAIEFVLDTALAAIPDLVDESIEQVGAPQAGTT